MDCLTLEGATDKLCRNVGNYHYTLLAVDCWCLGDGVDKFSRNVDDYPSILRAVDCSTFEDETDGLSETSVAISLPCVTSQTGEDLVCIAAEALNHALYLFVDLSSPFVAMNNKSPLLRLFVMLWTHSSTSW